MGEPRLSEGGNAFESQQRVQISLDLPIIIGLSVTAVGITLQRGAADYSVIVAVLVLFKTIGLVTHITNVLPWSSRMVATPCSRVARVKVASRSELVRWKIGFAPGAMAAVVITFNSTVRATAESTTSSLRNCLVRHVAADASKTREVNAGTTAGEGKSALIPGSTRWASPSAGSAKIRGAASVHQESLIR